MAIAFSELFANKLLFDSWQYDGVMLQFRPLQAAYLVRAGQPFLNFHVVQTVRLFIVHRDELEISCLMSAAEMADVIGC